MIKVNKKEREYANLESHINTPTAALAVMVTKDGHIKEFWCKDDKLFVHYEDTSTRVHVFQTYPRGK